MFIPLRWSYCILYLIKHWRTWVTWYWSRWPNFAVSCPGRWPEPNFLVKYLKTWNIYDMNCLLFVLFLRKVTIQKWPKIKFLSKVVANLFLPQKFHSTEITGYCSFAVLFLLLQCNFASRGCGSDWNWTAVGELQSWIVTVIQLHYLVPVSSVIWRQTHA